jgi:hypothetical protein
MHFRCAITYRTNRSSQLSIWRCTGQGKDHVSIVESSINRLKRVQRRPVTVIGVNVMTKDVGGGWG